MNCSISLAERQSQSMVPFENYVSGKLNLQMTLEVPSNLVLYDTKLS